MPSASPDRLARIATWNIHGAIGPDRRCDPERIARVVRSFDADIVALQEVDGRTHLRRRDHAFETMAELLGGEIVEARLIGKPGREHGHILWSRWPIRDARVHRLPGGLEQRGVIEAQIALPGGDLTVFGTHLGLSPITRLRQARAIAQRAGRIETGPIVALGDLNEWLPWGLVDRSLRSVLPRSLKEPSFPARRPFAPLDRIYASADLLLDLVASPAEARSASDHKPVLANVRAAANSA